MALSDEALIARLCPVTTLEAWTFTAKEIREALQGERVLCPSIELSNACNLNCPYCYVEHAESLNKEQYADQLTVAQIEDLIRCMADSGARTINIIGAGEPTVDPAFEQIVRLIASLGIKPLVATNGIKIATSPQVLAAIVETRSSVVLKCNSRDGKLQDFLVGSKGYAALRDKAFEALLNAGLNRSRPTRLALNSLLMRANLGEIPQLQEFCRRSNVALIAGDYMPTGRTSGGEFRGELVLEQQGGVCGAALAMFGPLDHTQRDSLAHQMASLDEKLGIPPLPVVAYASGIPCVQALGVCVDNRGRIWHCPARQQIVDGRMVSSILADVRNMPSLLWLWQNSPYPIWVRRNFDGGCPYKTRTASRYLGMLHPPARGSLASTRGMYG